MNEQNNGGMLGGMAAGLGHIGILYSMKASLITLIFALGVSSQSWAKQDGPYGARSVDWYKAHVEERNKQLTWCREQSIAVQMNSQGCSQALTAARQASAIGKMPAGY